MKIETQQFWKFNCDHDLLDSAYIWIGRIDISHPEENIIHISVFDINFNKEYLEIAHLPIALDSLLKSLKKMKKMKKSVTKIDKSTFEEGLKYWEEANGGVWNIPLEEVITNIIHSTP